MADCARILINVRGTIYETKVSTLSRFPDTLLGSTIERSKHFDRNRDEMFFDRDTEAFECILFYYQSGGILAKPSWVALEAFEEECRYFGINEDRLAQLHLRETGEERGNKESVMPQGNFRSKVWVFLEHPESSLGATIYSLIIFTLILASLCVEFALTMPGIKSSVRRNKEHRPTAITGENVAEDLLIFEMLFHVLFATEFLTRILFCPNMLRFFISASNIVDILAIFPYFLNLSIYFKNVSANLDYLRVLRTFRVLRMFRLSKHSRTLKAVVTIIKNCFEDFLVLAQCVLVACVLFGSLGYYTEMGNPNTQFTSIPESMWWAIQTMVCLGYGDIVPSTTTGKFAGAWVAILGAITLTVPLVSIGGKYMFAYTNTFALHMGRDMKITASDCNGQKDNAGKTRSSGKEHKQRDEKVCQKKL